MKKLLSSAKMLHKHYKTTSTILKKVFKESLSLESSRRIVLDRLQKRKENFLEMMEKCIFAHPASPYRVLLDRAGYRYEDVKKLVEKYGIEPALRILYKKGVYIDILEFKGKKEVIRGNHRFSFKEKDFSNPLLTEGLQTKTGGTRSAGTEIVVPFEYIEQHNSYGVLAADEYGVAANPVIIWLSILPAGDGLFFSLRFAAMGNPPVKWFSPVDTRVIKPSVMDRFKTKSTIWMSRLYGKKMPAPEFVDMRHTIEIARWMNKNLKNHRGFTVLAYPSSALRLIVEAKRANLKLGETVFWLLAEPLTEKIRQEIEGFGCKAYALYGCNELMLISHGCGNPSCSDDMHLLEDKLALIQSKRTVTHSDLKVDSFLFTTLLKTSPKIFLNTETGDYGITEKSNCGCSFEELGFSKHIHSIRSFEKLTAEGATFIGSDLIPLVQEILPEEFGGSTGDYQFVEEADEKGYPRLYILISPEVGEIDEDKLKHVVFEALTRGEYTHSHSRSLWTQAGTIQIRRINPIPTKRGKVYPLHMGINRLL